MEMEQNMKLKYAKRIYDKMMVPHEKALDAS